MHIAYLGALGLLVAWGGFTLVILMIVLMGFTAGGALALLEGNRVSGGFLAYWPIYILTVALIGIGRFIHDVADEYVIPYLGFVALCGFLLLTLIAGHAEVAVHLAGLVHLVSCAGIITLFIGALHCCALNEIWAKVCAALSGLFLALSGLAYFVGLTFWLRFAVQFMRADELEATSLDHGASFSFWIGLSVTLFVAGLLFLSVVVRRVAQASDDAALTKESLTLIVLQGVILLLMAAQPVIPARADLVLMTWGFVVAFFLLLNLVLLVAHVNRVRWVIR